MSERKLYAVDCETDPFKVDRVPEPFIWGAYDGTRFYTFNETETFVEWVSHQNALMYAHNGGRFDFMFLLRWLAKTHVKIIKSRLVQITIGRAILRDSWSIIPIALADYQKTKFDYWKLEVEHREHHREEIVSYLRDDCVNLFDLVSLYREQAGKGLTIATNALAHSRKLGIDIGKTNKKHDDKFRPFYFGGRCEAFQTGVFEDVTMLDIRSAYPFAMTHQHPTGPEYTMMDNTSDMTRPEIERSFIELECKSAGAFCVRGKTHLLFPHDYGIFFTTGWEYLAALDLGLIHDIAIRNCYQFVRTLDFTKYVNHWFAHKETAREVEDKANYVIGKIMLNSLYGKLAQNPIKFKDYKIMPGGSELDKGWNLEAEFYDKEIHSRSTLWTLKKEHGDDWQTFNKFYNVATGASVTGFVRSMLLRAINIVGSEHVLYCDTDSLFVGNAGDLHNLQQGRNIGEWDTEAIAFTIGIAGRKLYAAEIPGGWKIASKGARLTHQEIYRLCEGEIVEWYNEAPTFSLDGSAKFIHRKIVPFRQPR